MYLAMPMLNLFFVVACVRGCVCNCFHHGSDGFKKKKSGNFFIRYSLLRINPFTQCYKKTTWKASLQSIQPLQKMRVDDHQSAHPSYWYKSGCVALLLCIITLGLPSFHFQVFERLATLQAPLLALHLPKSHTKFKAIIRAYRKLSPMR